MKKLFLVFSVAVSSFGFGQTQYRNGVDVNKYFYDDSVFLAKNKLDESKLRLAILAEINVQRKLNNLTKLTLASNEENNKASVWGDTLIARGVLGHDNEYIMDYKNNKNRGEIVIAYTIATYCYNQHDDIYTYLARDIVNEWMLSPGHRAAILKTDVTLAAVGNSYGSLSAREYGISCRSIVRFF